MPSKTDINPVTGQMYAVNPATGNFDDNYWANVVEPQLRSGGDDGGGNTAEDLLKSFMDPIMKEYHDYEKRQVEFDTENPWAFDEAQARESSREIVDPYYDQLLSEFIEGVSLQRKQGVTQERQLLESLSREKEYETGEFRQKVEDAINTTEQGFEQRGLFASGLRETATGKIEAERNIRERRANELYGERETGIKTDTRSLLDRLGLGEGIRRRELATGRREEVETGVEKRRRESEQQHEIERIQVTAPPFGGATVEEMMKRLLQYQ